MGKNLSDALLVYPRPGLYQSIAVGAASVEATNALDITTRIAYLYSDTDCHYRFGATGAAALVTDTFLPAGVQTLIRVRGGYFVQAIQDSAGGTLHISEMTY